LVLHTGAYNVQFVL